MARELPDSCDDLGAGIREHFAEVTDPRRKEPTYPLLDMIITALCAVIGGADDFVAIAAWAKANKEWLSRLIDTTRGTPSHDRFNAVFAALRPEEFEKSLLSWITSLHAVTDGQVIAVDGKTLRRSYDRASSQSAIHMVSAWATVNHISLGQVVVDQKSNEITAIPELLRLIDISGAMVTIDAMGCQTAIASAIIDQGGNYCLTAKQNQPTLGDGIEAYFEELIGNGFRGVKCRKHDTYESGHGRKESRHYRICPVPDNLPDRQRWKQLKAIGMAVRITTRDGREHTEIRYYILSRYTSGRDFAEAVRRHWGIENQLHWQLDVSFGEDQSRIRKGHAATNFSLLRRSSLSLLKNEKSSKVGIRNRRLTAAWDTGYLEKVLLGQ